MRFGRLAVLLFWIFGLAGAARAEVLVLVHGYLASPINWRTSGVAAALAAEGWRDAGHLALGPNGVMLPPPVTGRRFHTIDLPNEAPIAVQAELISLHVAALTARDKDEKIILVGHSAGGVAARMAMVMARNPAIKGLVTIASPHLGSGLASKASVLSNSPVGWAAPLFGAGTLARSGALYRDLGEESPWNLVGWLNRQVHPKARYVSVIRSADGSAVSGDRVSQAWRQDLRMVPALRGLAEGVVTPAGHGLVPADGKLVSDIVNSFGLALDVAAGPAVK
ncbi:MAG: alpha/beta fold hydrolase [Rhizobiaceae bacterium]